MQLFKNTDVYMLDYASTGIIAIKAIQEQQKQIDDLKKENADLKAEIEKIKLMIESLDKK